MFVGMLQKRLDFFLPNLVTQPELVLHKKFASGVFTTLGKKGGIELHLGLLATYLWTGRV